MGDVFEVKYFGVDPKTRKEKVSRKAVLPKPEGYVERERNSDNRHRSNNDRRGGDKDRKPRRDSTIHVNFKVCEKSGRVSGFFFFNHLSRLQHIDFSKNYYLLLLIHFQVK